MPSLSVVVILIFCSVPITPGLSVSASWLWNYSVYPFGDPGNHFLWFVPEILIQWLYCCQVMAHDANVGCAKHKEM